MYAPTYMYKNAYIRIIYNDKNLETQISINSRKDEDLKIIYYTATKMNYIYKEHG